MISFIFFFGLISCLYGNKKPTTLNEYDTYNADECQRIRRPWNKLSSEERDLYISGLLELRNNGNGDIDQDELISIGSVHADNYAPFIHKTSSYLFWHGYLTWELESRIRNLGGKYRCFGMPYWDFSLESGREHNPTIFEGGEIGGNGDPDNYWTVNEFSWRPSTKQYWVPNNCVAENDKYPICSLKRALRADFVMPTAQDVGNNIMNNPDFLDFASYSHVSGSAIHLIDDHPLSMDVFPQSYEPIWYMFHSNIQMHQALWTDCNDYDLINVNDLDQHPEAFTPFCNSYASCSGKYNSKWTQWDLDGPMHFGGSLVDKEWSYIHNNDLTIRKLYMLPKWNIIYDLGDGDGFYTASGLNQYCKGKLNNHWFILNEKDKNDENEHRIEAKQDNVLTLSYLHYPGNQLLIIALVIILIGLLLRYLAKQPHKIKIYDGQSDYIYGSV